MIRPFGLQDMWLVRRLQRSGMSLAIEHMLTHPHEPFWTALTAPWPWAGGGIATYVLDEQASAGRITGFAQLAKRATRPEADVLYLAPASPLSNGSTTADVWDRLLTHCCLAAASHGLQRVFAGITPGCPEQDHLKRAGFSLYARETIFRLASLPPAGGALVGFRAQRPQDSWALQRLYARGTPRLVQQAEGATTGDFGSPFLSWWEPENWHGIIWEPAGEVRGAVQVHLGRVGHWLRIWGANELAGRELRALIEQGLGHIQRTDGRSEQRQAPVFVSVRDYDFGLSAALTGFGFAPYVDRARFVKHTVAMVREPALTPATTRELPREIPVRSQARDG